MAIELGLELISQGAELAIDEIKRKLSVELRETATTERHVVYVLVQARKLMERQNDDPANPRYPALKLYCNWVAHPGLINAEAKRIVRKANELFPKIVAGTLSTEEKAELQDQYKFTTLRADMDRFIEDNDLPRFTDQNWNWFVAQLMRVLEDCPLSCKSTENPLADVDEVVLRSEPQQTNEHVDGNPPRIVWGFFKDGQDRHWLVANDRPLPTAAASPAA